MTEPTTTSRPRPQTAAARSRAAADGGELARELTSLEAPAGAIRVHRRAPAPAAADAARAPAEVEPDPTSAERPESYARFAVLAVIVLAVCVLVAQVAGALSGSGGALSGLRTSHREVAPGARIELSGGGAAPGERVAIETRSRRGGWRSAGDAIAGDDGRFAARVRAVGVPGVLALRARGENGTAAPVKIAIRPLRLAVAGDIDPAAVRGGSRWPWESAGPALLRADIAVGNLAGTQLGERALAGLRRHAGVDVLGIPPGATGAGRSFETPGLTAVAPGVRAPVLRRLGLQVAFVGFSIPPGKGAERRTRIASAVRAAGDRADLVVAMFRWGSEGEPIESIEQRELARAAVGAGADVVVGVGPHVLQSLRREAGAAVAYSLGDLVARDRRVSTNETGVLELDLTADGIAAVRWRRGRIQAGRPLIDAGSPRRLPLHSPLAAGSGLRLGAELVELAPCTGCVPGSDF